MNIYDLKWNPIEKKTARTAFNKAYQREMDEIKNSLIRQVGKIKDDKSIWSIHNYLTERRNIVDKKYDYRYSQLILVFSRLMREGYLTEEDLFGLNEDKIEIIKNLSSNK